MKILLVNVDAPWNLAIRKMYSYYSKDHEVDMIDVGFSGYPHNKSKTIDASKYDKVFVSNIFEINSHRVTITGCSDVTYGGIGSRNPDLQLPHEIENTEPFYFDEEDTSWGFITRGCIRNCWFCKVPKHEGKIRLNNSVDKIIKHKKVKFLDNNILAYDKHLEILQHLVDLNIRCEFTQGLDFRLVNDDNLELLSRLNYIGEYIFAFDEPKYQPLLEEKIKLIKKYIPKEWKIKFYIYYHPSMKISELIERVEWCRKNKCLPYVMRDSSCWECDYKNFLIDFTAYCNQPAMFKKKTFEDFMSRYYELNRCSLERMNETLKVYTDNMR